MATRRMRLHTVKFLSKDDQTETTRVYMRVAADSKTGERLAAASRVHAPGFVISDL